MSNGNKKIAGYIKPMLTTAVDHAFSDKDWIFEIKFDGFRAIADWNGKAVKLYSRNGLSMAERFPEIINAVRELPPGVVLDGEIVVLDDKGNPDFQKLQNFKDNKNYRLAYYAFDLLATGNKSLMKLPLLERKKLLKKLVNQKGIVRYSAHVSTKGERLFAAAKEDNLEGIIAKKKDSLYAPGVRTKEWLKIKYHKSQEAIIIGYTAPRGARSGFGALLLAEYVKKKLRYIGHAGTGFTNEGLRSLLKKMKPLERKTSPLDQHLKTHGPVTWLKPSLVCEVAYAEVTRDGMLRQAVFKGLRADKKIASVQIKTELPAKVERIIGRKTRRTKSAK